MKKILASSGMLLFAIIAIAQTVGINTINPQATFDVRGSQRFGGNSSYLKFDSATGRFEWIGASLYVPTLQQIIRHSASSEGLYAGGGKLEYRNQVGSPVFFSSWANGNGYFSGNLGIGTTTPLTRLHVFRGASGNTTPFSPLVVEGSDNTYINLLSPDFAETAILFGNTDDAASGGIVYSNYNSYHGFQFRTNGNTTRMVLTSDGNLAIGDGVFYAAASLDVSRGTGFYGTAIFRGTNHISHFNYGTDEDTYIRAGKNGRNVILNDIPDGKVGIGTNNPNAPLGFPALLGKKITLYPGATGDVGFGVAGNRLQIYSDNPNADVAIGYDAAGVFNERLAIKPNGALAVNGNLGAAGQILQSNGNAAAAWASPTNVLYNTTNMFKIASNLVLNDGAPSALVPGFDYTFSVSGNAKAQVNFTLEVFPGSCAFCGASSVMIDLYLNSSLQTRYRWDIANGAITTLTGSYILTVGPGTHHIQIFARNFGPAVNSISGGSIASNMIVQVIPQ